ncbi:MAG: SusC/RagA family TonB-linked outer membrane protein [Bacteroidales bacterium]|nr:SusC/RagA family TonB-linked outer membrane protein [Bacteroidales bacterium]MDD4771407.1 SusC/RagA family TonB-linked outer membrane protein [Bacteroidales bacterium]
MRNSIRIFLLMTMLIFTGVANAQEAGSIIRGVVQDDLGPLSNANVLEIDDANRIVSHTVADVNGNFSLRVVNPKNNKLRVSYIGFKNVTLPIDRMNYKIVMVESTVLDAVVITAKTMSEGSGLIVPTREISGAMQKIDAAEFEGLGITTIDEALQGRIAGLDIVFNSGNLGSGTSMRMRGAASINGTSEPLIVVDGNVWESDQADDFDFNSANDEKFAQLLNINPEDIQSITVLKDAASTAIWGSQGANGVIEIRTKRGAVGPTRVTYSYRFSGTYQPEGMKMMNGDQYTMLLKESYFNPTLNDAASNISELNYNPSFSEYEMYNNNTDWVAAVKQFGMRHNHNLALSGGGQKARFRISAGYDKEFGTIIGQELDRFSTRVALDYTVSDRIEIKTNFNMTYTDNDKNYSDLLSKAYQKMPNLSIYEEDANGNSTGEYYHMLSTASSAFNNNQKGIVNPVALAYQASSNSSTINISPEFVLRYDLLGMDSHETQLNYEGTVNFQVFNDYGETFYPATLVTAGWSNENVNYKTNSANKSQSVTTRHTLTFMPKFDNIDHSFSMLVRGQMTDGTSNNLNYSKAGLPNVESNVNPGTIRGFGTGVNQWRSMYFTGSMHYAYKSKYILDFTSRLDATTKFGPNQRWGFFPAVSLRWNVSDEAFMDGISWVNMLSIRPSWGLVGNQPGSEYLYFSRYASGPTYNGEPSVYPSNIRLNNLKWEEVEKYNIGFDYGLFGDRLFGDVNLYQNVTTDLLMSGQGIPSSSGYPSLSYLNGGSMQNRGWELNIQSNKVISAGDFSADVNFTFANNRNEILSMDETILNGMNNEFNYSNGQYLSRIQLNTALGSIYGFRYKGVYQYTDYSAEEVVGVSGPNAPVVHNADGEVVLMDNGEAKPMYFAYGTNSAYEFQGGDAKYEDINNDGNINELDIVYLGSSLPKITGGFGFRLRYGRFSLNNQFNFRVGNKVVNRARMNAENMYSNNNQSMAVCWRWRVEGDETPIPRALYNYGYNWLGSDRFVEDGSFLRLNYSQFSYSVDPKVIKAYGLSQLSISVSASNLFLLTRYSGVDPEVGYGSYGIATDNAQTPRSKSFTASLTASF